MRIFIVTQTVDKNDEVLGFFHRWLGVFSKSYESVSVICLKKGSYDLPANVKVNSLGKEEGVSRLTYLFRFYRLIIGARRDYDAVLVHMNQEYVLLGGLLWKIFGKPVFLWRNHRVGNFLTDMAVLFCDKVFCTSPESYTARFPKTVIMPVGIDTEFFSDADIPARVQNSILFFGRIAKIKKPDLFLSAVSLIKNEKISVKMVGSYLPKDEDLKKELEEIIEKNSLGKVLKIEEGVPFERSREYYREADVYVNLTESGSLDKTILEAMSSGSLPVVANRYFENVLPRLFLTKDNRDGVAKAIQSVLKMTDEDKERYRIEFRGYVVKNHSLALLATRLAEEIKPVTPIAAK
jgi:glycosyltransferase involved in cell wall biosynthesis